LRVAPLLVAFLAAACGPVPVEVISAGASLESDAGAVPPRAPPPLAAGEDASTSASGGSVCPSGGRPESEPNDAAETAQPLDGSGVCGVVTAADRDVYEVVVPAAPAFRGLVLAPFESATRLRATVSQSGGSSFFAMTVTGMTHFARGLAPGPYLVSIELAEGDSAVYEMSFEP
jgi:hypothetical protein